MSVSGSEGLATTAMTEATQPDGKAAHVSERKFNGTATLNVEATSESAAKPAAREYFRETQSSDPSKVVVQEDNGVYINLDKERYEVMVADHSSGSLSDDAEYHFGGDDA